MKALLETLRRIPPAGGHLPAVIRWLLLSGCLLGLDYSIDFNLHPLVLIGLTAAGVWAGSYLTLTGIRALGVLLSHGLLVAVAVLLLRLALSAPLSGETLLLINQGAETVIGVLAGVCLLSAITWAFWKYPLVGVLEILAIAMATIQTFSAHRNFRFDTAKSLNEISWYFQLHPLVVLVCIGSLLAVLIALYFSMTTRAALSDPRLSAGNRVQRYSLQSRTSLALGSILLSAILIGVSLYVYQQNQSVIDSRLRNGVSDEAKEGLSPLGFHSALGASSQPAALVRLENDYPQNPFTPMLYLREAALSEYNGKQMVMAPTNMNPDVPDVPPGSAYRSDGFPDQYERTPVTQSMYLLTDHKLAFGIDYPLSINALKPPQNTRKFKAAFRVYSMAPTFSRSSLQDLSVGDPDWTAEEWEHFTEVPEDPRYRELALKIIGDEQTPVLQASALVEFLNKNAIYTLTPGHEVAEDADPVEPFLFGDFRGYCVHFAHATVYMLRTLGIPARIGTGYLTDLSQAKDGHILLRMSDRHAWAEVYVNGYGWVPFDTEPEQVEVHAETPVDAGLLEELMGLLEPGEEILPEDILKDEASEKDTNVPGLFAPDDVFYFLLLIILSGIFAKLFIVFRWRLPGSPQKTLDRGWLAICTRLADLGIRRIAGETTSEFVARVQSSYQTRPVSTPPLLLLHKYSSAASATPATIRTAIEADLKALTSFPYWQRFISFFNPLSLFVRVQPR